jgi:hypothetical protein
VCALYTLSSLDLTTIDVLILWMREIMTGGNPIQITTFNYWCEIHPFMFTVVKITSMKHLMLLKVEAPNEALLLLLFQATICLQSTKRIWSFLHICISPSLFTVYINPFFLLPTSNIANNESKISCMLHHCFMHSSHIKLEFTWKFQFRTEKPKLIKSNLLVVIILLLLKNHFLNCFAFFFSFFCFHANTKFCLFY